MTAAGYGDVRSAAVGRRLRAARELRGLTQKDVGDLLGVSEGVYQGRESGRSALSVAEAWIVEQKLNVDARFVLFGEPKQLHEEWSAMRAQLELLPQPDDAGPPKRGRPPKRARGEQLA